MKRLAIISNIILILISAASIPLALTSVMLFDAPGSESNPFVWILFFSALALPFTCFISIIISLWFYFKHQAYKKAFWVSLIPAVVIVCIIINLVLIQELCQGSFSCR